MDVGGSDWAVQQLCGVSEIGSKSCLDMHFPLFWVTRQVQGGDYFAVAIRIGLLPFGHSVTYDRIMEHVLVQADESSKCFLVSFAGGLQHLIWQGVIEQ